MTKFNLAQEWVDRVTSEDDEITVIGHVAKYFDIQPVFKPAAMTVSGTKRSLALYVGYNNDGVHGYFVVNDEDEENGVQILEFIEKRDDESYQFAVDRLKELMSA